MATETRPAERLGYERALLLLLSVRDRRNLNSLSTGLSASAFLLGVPLGYAAWLIEKNFALSLLVSGFVALMVQNFFRLVTAGGGTALHLPLPRDYRPSPLPLIILFGLALLLAQPAQLILPNASADRAVDVHREELLEIHRVSQATLETPSDSYAADLASCDFILERLRLIWDAPERAMLLSLLYSGMVICPLLLGRSAWLESLTAYERVRYRRARELFVADHQRTQALVRTALLPYLEIKDGATTPSFLRARLSKDASSETPS